MLTISNTPRTPSYMLPIIVISQVAGTSLWFAGNAVIVSLQEELGLALTANGHVTSAVQVGFIIGTLTFALLTIADRFSPSRYFLSAHCWERPLIYVS